MKKIVALLSVLSLFVISCGKVSTTCRVAETDTEKSQAESIFFKQLWDSGDAMFTFMDADGAMVSTDGDNWISKVKQIEFNHDGKGKIYTLEDPQNIKILLTGNTEK